MATPSFDWTQYDLLAQDLSKRNDEASKRSAISRAYYAVFHAATLQAQPNGYKDRSHGRLWKTYHADTDLACKKLSAIGNEMKRAREQADYEASIVRIDDVMAQQLLQVKQFTRLLATVQKTAPQPLPPAPKKTCPFCFKVLP